MSYWGGQASGHASHLLPTLMAIIQQIWENNVKAKHTLFCHSSLLKDSYLSLLSLWALRVQRKSGSFNVAGHGGGPGIDDELDLVR